MGVIDITSRGVHTGERPARSLQPLSAPRDLQFPSVAGIALPKPGMDGRRSVILEADDLGLLYAFNEGIRAAYRDGCLTSTCLRANGYAYEHAVQEVLPDCADLGVGVHLCLNEGESVAPRGRISGLLASNGSFRNGFVWLMRLARSEKIKLQIERELRAQIERVLESGIAIDHLNSHQHVHMIPEVFRITTRLASEYRIPCVRLVRELPYRAGGLRKRVEPLLNTNYAKYLLLNRFARTNESTAREHGIPTTDYFLGVNYTANMSINTVRRGLRAAPYGSVEVLLHPAIGPDPRDVRYPHPSLEGYVCAPQRAVELQALRVPALSEFLRRETWMPMNFAIWARGQQARRPRESRPEISAQVHEICTQTEVSGPPWVSAAQDDSRAFAELVMTQTNPGQRVLDLGTGTGIVGICLAKAGRQVVAGDISRAALRTAAANARHHGVEIVCHESDLLASVPGRFDLIAFNLPYNFRPDTFTTNVAKNLVRRIPWIRRRSGLSMPRPVLKFHQQLVDRLIHQAPEHLASGGALLLHVYDAEVPALNSVLPPGTQVELLHHDGLTNRTVGMRIRFEP